MLANRTTVGRFIAVLANWLPLGEDFNEAAHTSPADVTGVELTPARVKGTEELTHLVGLQNNVRVIEGNVMQVPLPDNSVDVVISQEALIMFPTKGAR
jgi:ubiquinone/menaquinone biosynthesis C-methylase UbiE